ncbi:2OG-Fe(II) oxygenase [Leptospira fluminis]|uniref:2OG-Fe(II) oxygenase n=1 Tax=Leptospira fluminis TaxID=2484979 RepID=A0A4R9GM43_9LEPT|nr:2OG-Fe(II) oxygenase [Leptospira fluminis]TGK17284.1 2OG-Fe(II) oxygenase [Leptospira fluminis]
MKREISFEDLVERIQGSLSDNKDKLRKQFANSINEVGVRYCALDGLLPKEWTESIYRNFPANENMRFMSSFRERKYTSKNFDRFHPLLRDITFAIQDPKVIEVVESITGIKGQKADPSLYAGGLSAMDRGNFLNPHIDNSHEMTRKMYRTLNLLFYVTPDWSLEKGGNLELWDESVLRNLTIESKFNRLAIMETNPWSWHSVSPVVADEGRRCCVSNYYFSEISPIGKEYFNVTSFNGRPGQPFRRALSYVDGRFRNFVRLLLPRGLGKKDIYTGSGLKR